MDFAKFFQPCQISKYLCFLFFIPAPISSLPFQYVFSINFIPSIHRFPHSLSLKSSLRLQLPTATMCAIFSQPDPTIVKFEPSELRERNLSFVDSIFHSLHLAWWSSSTSSSCAQLSGFDVMMNEHLNYCLEFHHRNWMGWSWFSYLFSHFDSAVFSCI